jgi:putative oxidoreductase
MATIDAFATRWSPRMLSVLRIVSGFLFLLHGSQKLFGIPAGQGVAPVPLVSLMGVAGILEFVGGLLVLFGVFTRPVAFILSGEMAAAYFMAHAPRGPLPLTNGGEPAALYAFIFLFLAAAGGGPWSLDRLWRNEASPKF